MRRRNPLMLLTCGCTLFIALSSAFGTVAVFNGQRTLHCRIDHLVDHIAIAGAADGLNDVLKVELQDLRMQEQNQTVFFNALASTLGFVSLCSFGGLIFLARGKLAEADRTRVQLAVTQAIIESTSIEQVFQRVLEAMGELYHFAFGAVWLIDESIGLIKPKSLWMSSTVKERAFYEATPKMAYKIGIGLPGRVWQSGRANWINDVVVDTNYPRHAAALKTGLHAALGFPILRDGKVVGVVEFYFPKILPQQKGLIDLLSPFGQEIGQFLERIDTAKRLIEDARIATFAAHVGSVWGSGADLEQMLKNCAELAVEHLDAQFACAWLPCQSEKCYQLYSQAGDSSALPDLARLCIDDKTIDVLKNSTGRFVRNGLVVQKLAGNSVSHPRVPLMVEPLMVGQDLVGLIAVLPRVMFSRQTLPSLSIASKNIALGISRTQLSEKLVASDRLFSELTKNIEEMIWVTQPGGFGLKWVSPALAKFFQRSQEELIKEPMLTVETIHESDRAAALEFFRYNSSSAASIEYRQRSNDGKWRWIWSRTYPTFDEDGLLAEVYGIATDITSKKEREKQVQEFYSMVSHELRTPLTSVHASLRILEAGLAGPLNETGTRLVTIARSESDRLIRLINDILDIRKIEAGMLDLKPRNVSVEKAVELSLAEMKGMADSAGVTLVSCLEWDGVFLADQDRLMQMIENLLSNAIKFSPAGAEVKLIVERAGDYVRFSVIDRGPGISTADQGKLFGKFQQLDSSDSRPKGGTGLGLAITRAIAQQHGGEAGVESTLGEGSKFWIRLPIAGSIQKNVPVIKVVEQELNKFDILLIEQDADFAETLTAELGKFGFVLKRVDSFEAADQLISRHKPAAILADLEGSSDEGLRWIDSHASDKTWPKTIVLAESVNFDHNAKNTRRTAWHRKPVSIARLRGALSFAVTISGTFKLGVQ